MVTKKTFGNLLTTFRIIGNRSTNITKSWICEQISQKKENLKKHYLPFPKIKNRLKLETIPRNKPVKKNN